MSHEGFAASQTGDQHQITGLPFPLNEGPSNGARLTGMVVSNLASLQPQQQQQQQQQSKEASPTIRGPISTESRELRFINEVRTDHVKCIFCNEMLPKAYAEIQKHIDMFHKPITTKAQREEQQQMRNDLGR